MRGIGDSQGHSNNPNCCYLAKKARFRKPNHKNLYSNESIQQQHRCFVTKKEAKKLESEILIYPFTQRSLSVPKP